MITSNSLSASRAAAIVAVLMAFALFPMLKESVCNQGTVDAIQDDGVICQYLAI